MKKLVILIFSAFSTFCFAQEAKDYKITPIPVDRGGTWGAIPTSNGQLIFTDNDAKVSKGEDFPSRLIVMDSKNNETVLALSEKYQRIGSPYLSSDSRELYFAVSGTVGSEAKGSNIFKSGTVYHPLQILISKKSGNEWAEPEAFIHNSNSFSNGDPCLSADGSYLYFASDREGGQGGTDIWRSKRNSDGSWGEPENLGTPINTDGDERFPRFDSKGNMYFSSTSAAGSGLDLFKSTVNGNRFGTPVRMNYPFNSVGDDFAISFITEETGYLSSSRLGSDKIFYFEPIKQVVVRDTIKIIEPKTESAAAATNPDEAFSKLKYIYFDYNKSDLRLSETPSLMGLATFMNQYPNTAIELPSYADCRGSNTYNIQLSKKRGEAVKKYLVEAVGINANRVVVSERGATGNFSNCDCSKANCNDAQYQANRRVEYKLLKK